MVAQAEQPVSNVFVLACERFGEKYGAPVPKRLLEIGGDTGWLLRLNPTNEAINEQPPVSIAVYHKGHPVGVFGPNGGVLMASGGVRSTESELVAWLEGFDPQPAGA